ncbi:RNA polymerase sigma factor [Actinomadura sp. LOL_016]|uniref:RNA polymerase sigma factor n=1 Tax=unclassified Actinomadura TaxID=2626254 RepID=UPI003A80249F
MDDQELVEALRVREPGAPASVYSAYAERLYAYCWFRTQARDDAQVALRDTFIAAEAHIDKLRDPELFGPWLYAIARLQCARRPPSEDRTPDPPVASHDQEDVVQRLISWNAVQALSPLSQDLLDLHVRHGLSIPELAAVLGLVPGNVQVALDRAHKELEQALTAEMLEGQGPYGCAERAALLKERSGGGDVDGRLLKHAEGCAQCGVFRPRSVSASKVFGLLPVVTPPDELQLRVVSCFTDPELVGYRLFVATGISGFAAGFPVQSNRPPPHGASARGRWKWATAGAATVVLLGGGGFVWVSQAADGQDAERVETVVGPNPTPQPGSTQWAPSLDVKSGHGPVPVPGASTSPTPGQSGADPRTLTGTGPAESGGGASTLPPTSAPAPPPRTSPSAPPPSKPPPPVESPPVTSPTPVPTDEPASPPATAQSPAPTG